MNLALLASRIRAEEKWILHALERRGVECERIDSRTLWGDGSPPRRRTVLNREIGHARALYAATLLEAQGALVVNSAAATETCGDKWRTTLALREAGLPTPRTLLALTPDAALDALDDLGYPAVVKPLVGSWGRLVTKLTSRPMAEAVLEHVAALPAPQSHIVYLQEYVPKPDRDIRVIVVGGEPVGGVWRRADQWRTNVARGAVSEAFDLGPELAKLATTACDAVAADIAGVDLIEDADGRPHVIEVNHGVEFAGFQKAVGDWVDVAGRIVDHLLSRAGS